MEGEEEGECTLRSAVEVVKGGVGIEVTGQLGRTSFLGAAARGRCTSRVGPWNVVLGAFRGERPAGYRNLPLDQGNSRLIFVHSEFLSFFLRSNGSQPSLTKAIQNRRHLTPRKQHLRVGRESLEFGFGAKSILKKFSCNQLSVRAKRSGLRRNVQKSGF